MGVTERVFAGGDIHTHEVHPSASTPEEIDLRRWPAGTMVHDERVRYWPSSTVRYQRA